MSGAWPLLNPRVHRDPWVFLSTSEQWKTPVHPAAVPRYHGIMDQRTFNGVAGIIFLLVAVLHALRVLYDWGALIGGWSVPMWASWIAIVIAGYLAVSAYRLMGRRR